MRLLLGLAGLLAAWAAVAWTGWVNPMFLATPGEAWRAGESMAAEGRLSADFAATLKRVGMGVGLACALGLPLGFLLGYYRRAYGVLEGAFDFLRSIPPIVVYPLAILMLDVHDASRVAVVVFGCVTVLVMQVAAGVAMVPPARLESVRLMGASSWALMRHVILPETLPHVFVALRTVCSLGLIIVVVTEMLAGAPEGLGARVVNAQMSYRTDELYAEIVLIGMLGFGVNHVLAGLERRVVHWKA